MFFITVVALCLSDIFKVEYCSSTVQQSLVFEILNADLQLQQILLFHIHTTLTQAIARFKLLCGLVSELISKFYINQIKLRTLKSLNTALHCQGQIQPNCKQLTIGSSQCNCYEHLHYTVKKVARDNFTCNEYTTQTNK